MADTGTESSTGGLKRKLTDEDEVCKDFLRGRCGFRANCKYYHPPGQEGSQYAGESEGSKRKLIFCKDFQTTNGCAWPVCRFIHSTKAEERDFLQSKYVTEKLAYAILAAGQGDKKDIGGREVCMDFMMGRCSRDFDKCRHLHVDPNKVTSAANHDRDVIGGERVCLDFLRGVCDRPRCKFSHNTNTESYDPYNMPPPNRGRGFARGGHMGGRTGSNFDGMGPGYGPGYGPPAGVGGGGVGNMAEQNAFLQQTVSRLKVQLASMNEEKQELMEQNTRLQAKVQKLVHQIAAGSDPTGGMGPGHYGPSNGGMPPGGGYM